MADQPVNNNNNSSDEIDLGQLFQLIAKRFNKIGIAFLRLFLYLKKHALILGGLIVIGLAAGYGLNQITEKKMKIEVIVKPNLESKDYLYNVVEEIENNIRSKNNLFFKIMGIEVTNLSAFKIEIEPVGDETDLENDLEYLELLEKFQANDEFSEVIKSELLNKSALSDKITFSFKNSQEGQLFAEKIMAYINSNTYFENLADISNQNALERIQKNEVFIEQIDGLISAYAQNMDNQTEQVTDGRIVLNSEEKMDITGLFSLKNRLIQDTEKKRLELKEREQAINIVNFGKPQQVKKVFFARGMVLIPTLLVGMFFFVAFVKYMNKKASEL
ncbi:MAG: hypothetical protein AAF348_17745 [Bacteroidota bacterium]